MIFSISKGSKVGIISPSSSIASPSEIETGLKYLGQTLGYNIVLGNYVFEDNHTLAGTPKQRAEDVMRFFNDKSIKAIFCTRGGYGGQYILPLLDYEVIKNNPKPIIGFSDVTALQMATYQKSKNINYVGPLLRYDFADGKINHILEQSLKNILSGTLEDLRGGVSVNKGTARGILLGTNLTVMQLLAGTDYYPDLENSILLLEDVDGASYAFEASLLQLKQQRGFNKVKGIIFGQFTDTIIRRSGQKDMNEVISEFAADLHIPIIKNFPFGHVKARSVIPLGIEAELDATNCTLKFNL